MIFGLETPASLPDGWMPLEAISVVKCLDDEGSVVLYLAGTETLSTWEAMGMLQAALDVNRDTLRGAFAVNDGGDQDQGS